MAKIKVAHLRHFLKEYSNDKISFSRLVGKLNEVAGTQENKALLIKFYNYIQENDIDHNIPIRIEKAVDKFIADEKLAAITCVGDPSEVTVCECKDEWLINVRLNVMKCKKCGEEF